LVGWMSRWPSWEQKQAIFRAAGYEPHELQLEGHQCEARVMGVFGGERSGKSRFGGMEALARLLWSEEMAIAGQEYERCQKEFGYLVEGLRAIGGLGKVSMPARGQWQLWAKSGCHVRTVSLNDGPEELTGTGEAFGVVVLVEAGLMRYEAFHAARGRVAETRGLVLMVGTLWDNFGWYADLYRSFEGPNVYGGVKFSFPAWANRAVYPLGEDDPEIQLLRDSLPEDEFRRRVMAELVPSPARIFPEFRHDLHVGMYPFDEEREVTLWIDPGYYPSAYCVLPVQFYPGEFPEARVIDEVYEHHRVHADVIEICRGRVWWDKVKDGVIDFAGRQHQAEKSAEEVWGELTGIWPRSQQVGKLDGITRHRTFLRDPGTGKARLGYDLKCTETIGEYGTFKRKTDRRGNVVSDMPDETDKSTGHGMDAVAYGLVDKYGYVERRRREPKAGKRRLPRRG